MSKRLIVLSQPGCGACMMVKNYLQHTEVEFETIDIRQDVDAVEKYNISSTPVTILETEDGIEIERFNGFNPDELEKLTSQI